MAGLSDLEDEDIQLSTNNDSTTNPTIIKPDIAEGFPEEEDLQQSVVLPKCRWCGTIANLVRKYLSCNHATCYDCAKARPQYYETIPQASVSQQYGLNADELKRAVKKNTVLVEEKRNPRGYENNMKLYYRFQLEELCAAKYGSLEDFQARRDERKQRRNEILTGSNASSSQPAKKKRKSDNLPPPRLSMCGHPEWTPVEVEGDLHSKVGNSLSMTFLRPTAESVWHPVP